MEGPGTPWKPTTPRNPTAPRGLQFSRSQSQSRAAQPKRGSRAPVPCHPSVARPLVLCRPRGTGARLEVPPVPGAAGSAGAHLDVCPVLPHRSPADRGWADRACRATPELGESPFLKANEPVPSLPARHDLIWDECSPRTNAACEGVMSGNTRINLTDIKPSRIRVTRTAKHPEKEESKTLNLNNIEVISGGFPGHRDGSVPFPACPRSHQPWDGKSLLVPHSGWSRAVQSR